MAECGEVDDTVYDGDRFVGGAYIHHFGTRARFITHADFGCSKFQQNPNLKKPSRE